MADVRAGMGAIPYDGGVAFRVWAPHADEVWVTGDFNEWSDDASPLADEGNGHWYADIAGATAGQEYKFVLRNGENTFHRVDPRAAQVTNSVGNGVVYDHGAFDWEGDDFVMPPMNEQVIYELHVGSFLNVGDGTADLHQVREKLGHLIELGVNVIELMPVMEFAGDYSWGYNPAHIFAIESTYGGPDALKMFVREAHRAGIGVIVDVVYNHFGPSDLPTWQFDGWSENDKGGIYFYNDWRASTPWGDTRPDYGRPEVRDFIRDNAMMWLRDYHADGLRYDMTPFIYSGSGGVVDLAEGWTLMRWVNESIREEFPHAVTIAEDLHQNHAITSLGDEGAKFHAQWDAAFVHPVRDALVVDDDAQRDMAEVAEALEHSYGDAFSRVIYTESHDEVANGKARVPQEVDGENPTGWHAQKRSTMGAALAFTAPGIPMLFQGQEFLEGLWFRDDVPLDWSKNEQFSGIVRFYRDLIRLRRNLDGGVRGLTGPNIGIIQADEEKNLVVFHRWMEGGPGDDVVVVVNLSEMAYEDVRVGVPAEGEWRLRMNSDAKAYSAIFGDFLSTDLRAFHEDEDGMPAHTNISIAPYAVLIYERLS